MARTTPGSVALTGIATAVLILFGPVRPARANLTVTSVNAGIEVLANGTYNVVDFYLTGLTGADTANQSNGGMGTAGLLDLRGTFTSTATGLLAVAGDDDPASAGYFGKYVTGAAPPSASYDTSFVTADGVTDLTRSGTGTSTVSGTGSRAVVTGFTGASRSFFGGFYKTVAIPAGSNTTAEGSNLVARILVTPGYGVAYSGIYTTYGSNSATTSFAYAAPIITLTAGTTAPYATFTRLTAGNATFNPNTPVADSINVSSVANGAAHATPAVPLDTAYVQASGFASNTDQLYAMKLSVGSTPLDPADPRVATIVGDINAFKAVDGVTASVVRGNAAAAAFAGYDILLTANGTFAAKDVLSWNFQNETQVPGLLVTDVAAAPEPTSLALLGIGGAGLVGRRRRR